MLFIWKSHLFCFCLIVYYLVFFSQKKLSKSSWKKWKKYNFNLIFLLIILNFINNIYNIGILYLSKKNVIFKELFILDLKMFNIIPMVTNAHSFIRSLGNKYIDIVYKLYGRLVPSKNSPINELLMQCCSYNFCLLKVKFFFKDL